MLAIRSQEIVSIPHAKLDTVQAQPPQRRHAFGLPGQMHAIALLDNLDIASIEMLEALNQLILIAPRAAKLIWSDGHVRGAVTLIFAYRIISLFQRPAMELVGRTPSEAGPAGRDQIHLYAHQRTPVQVLRNAQDTSMTLPCAS
jgi:hypothetical protein